MEWLPFLLLLICPLMMILCMRGHGSGHKHHDPHSKDIDKQISQLLDENAKLRNEVNNLANMVKKES